MQKMLIMLNIMFFKKKKKKGNYEKSPVFFPYLAAQFGMQ